MTPLETDSLILLRARLLAKRIEAALAGSHHVALTGGALYKEGVRKDFDFVIYAHNSAGTEAGGDYPPDDPSSCRLDKEAVAKALTECGLFGRVDFGRVEKWHGEIGEVDILFPEYAPIRRVDELMANARLYLDRIVEQQDLIKSLNQTIRDLRKPPEPPASSPDLEGSNE